MQAVQLTENNVMLIAVKTELPIADVQAIYEDSATSGVTEYIIFDYNVVGGYGSSLLMNKTLFFEKFYFPFGELPNKFMPIVSI